MIVGLGELLWDCFGNSRRPGGAPANFAFQSQQLGNRGIVCSRVGDDTLGNEILAFLKQQGLDTSFIQVDQQHATGTVTVDATEPDHPSYVIHSDVAWDQLELTAQFESLMQAASAVCFGTLAQRSPRSRTTIHQCLAATAAHCQIVYDINLRQRWYDREWIERSLSLADIVKLNVDEVNIVRSLLDIEHSDHTAFAQSLQQRFHNDIVCITRGEDGCLLVAESESVDVSGIKVDVSDAVGAGDAFAAALIDALLRKWPIRDAAEFANRIGSLVAARPGAMPSLNREFADLRSEFEE
jgi:fructokinase